MRTLKMLVLIAAVGTLAGCAANPFGKYYTSYLPDHSDLVSLPKGEEPKLIDKGDSTRTLVGMCEQGYILVGQSSFNGGVVSKSKALDEAKKIGASVVLFYSQYTNTENSQIPLILPSTQTSDTSAYGMIGSRPIFGQSTTSTYGTQTIYIPHTVQRYNYLATFWKKNAKPLETGLRLHGMTSQERREIGGNIGFKVTCVITGSPAFYANVLRGDVIERMGDIDLRVKSDLRRAAVKYKGASTTILLWHDGKTTVKHIKLN